MKTLKPSNAVQQLLTPEELCKRWKNKISIGTLRNWRAKGKGPRPTKIGGSIFYLVIEVENYEIRQTMRSV